MYFPNDDNQITTVVELVIENTEFHETINQNSLKSLKFLKRKRYLGIYIVKVFQLKFDIYKSFDNVPKCWNILIILM